MTAHSARLRPRRRTRSSQAFEGRGSYFVVGLDSRWIRLYSIRPNANGVTDRSWETGSMRDHSEWETKIDRENWEGRGLGQTVGREIDAMSNPSDLRPTLEGGYAPSEPRADARGHGSRASGCEGGDRVCGADPSDLRPTLEGGYAPSEPRTDARGHGSRARLRRTNTRITQQNS
jgi:hypothetical protein